MVPQEPSIMCHVMKPVSIFDERWLPILLNRKQCFKWKLQISYNKDCDFSTLFGLCSSKQHIYKVLRENIYSNIGKWRIWHIKSSVTFASLVRFSPNMDAQEELSRINNISKICLIWFSHLWEIDRTTIGHGQTYIHHQKWTLSFHRQFWNTRSIFANEMSFDAESYEEMNSLIKLCVRLQLFILWLKSFYTALAKLKTKTNMYSASRCT